MKPMYEEKKIPRKIFMHRKTRRRHVSPSYASFSILFMIIIKCDIILRSWWKTILRNLQQLYFYFWGFSLLFPHTWLHTTGCYHCDWQVTENMPLPPRGHGWFCSFGSWAVMVVDHITNVNIFIMKSTTEFSNLTTRYHAVIRVLLKTLLTNSMLR